MRRSAVATAEIVSPRQAGGVSFRGAPGALATVVKVLVVDDAPICRDIVRYVGEEILVIAPGCDAIDDVECAVDRSHGADARGDKVRHRAKLSGRNRNADSAVST